MFTKQHFIALAKFVKESNLENKTQLAENLAKLFSADNEKFNSAKFFKACGITKGCA